MDTPARPSLPRLACRALPPEHFLLSGVRLFDPRRGLDEMGDLLVEDGKIAALGTTVKSPAGAEKIVGYKGCLALPGFVDPHAHLRTPGFEYKEDLVSGSAAAAAGGYVTVVAMANTDPVIDRGPVATWVLDEAAEKAAVRIGQVGAISKGLLGEELAELIELAETGVIAFSDDGRPVADADLLLTAIRYARVTGLPLMLHLEDVSMSAEGVMHEGKWSARLGLRGIPSVCESGCMARDLEVIRYASAEGARTANSRGEPTKKRGKALDGVPLAHFQHLSAAESVDLLRRAKMEGLAVTGEATPEHLLLTDERLSGLDQNLKVNPPIRSEEDRRVLVKALAEGIIDCVATDHAPHAGHEKELPIEDALFGSTGLETAFAALHTGLVVKGELALERLVEAMSSTPCRVLGIDEPRLEVGAPADFCLVDLQETWEVTGEESVGKSRNCAFLGEKLTGRVQMTVVDGARRFARPR